MTFFDCSVRGPARAGWPETSNLVQKKTDSKKAFPVERVHSISLFIKSTVLSSSHFALPICLRVILPSRDRINVAGTR